MKKLISTTGKDPTKFERLICKIDEPRMKFNINNKFEAENLLNGKIEAEKYEPFFGKNRKSTV